MTYETATRAIDRDRIERLRAEMERDGLDALFLRLPENILYVSGFWPASGFCAALFTRDGDAKLFVPQGEVYTVEPGIYRDGWGGVRVEDVVLVGANGGENLSPYDRGLAARPSAGRRSLEGSDGD